MTKKEYTFWLLSSIFLIIGLVLVFSLRTKMNRENHYPKSFIRKKFFGLGFLFHSL